MFFRDPESFLTRQVMTIIAVCLIIMVLLAVYVVNDINHKQLNDKINETISGVEHL